MEYLLNHKTMRYYEKVFAVFLFLGISITGTHAQSNLYVKEKSGEQTSVSLVNLQAVIFNNGSLVLEKRDGSSFTYALSNVRYLSFTEYTDDITDPVTTSLKNTSAADINVFPNPANDKLFIQCKAIATVDVINGVGQVLFSQTVTGDGNIDVSGLAQGVYICRINQGATQSFYRFIKE